MVLFESIKIIDRQLQNIFYHNERFNRSRSELFGVSRKTDLEDLISIPVDLPSGIIKCRVFYSQQIEGIEFDPYIPRKISSLKLTESDDIDYSYKYANRTKINELFDQKGNCDDVLIIKNGMITDTSSANVAFWDGSQCLTPANPLLKGTKRQLYLDNNVIREEELNLRNINQFEYLSLINAMIDLDQIRINIENIME
jgi:4-amino-4-deoxychorismate lyase